MSSFIMKLKWLIHFLSLWVCLYNNFILTESNNIWYFEIGFFWSAYDLKISPSFIYTNNTFILIIYHYYKLYNCTAFPHYYSNKRHKFDLCWNTYLGHLVNLHLIWNQAGLKNIIFFTLLEMDKSFVIWDTHPSHFRCIFITLTSWCLSSVSLITHITLYITNARFSAFSFLWTRICSHLNIFIN